MAIFHPISSDLSESQDMYYKTLYQLTEKLGISHVTAKILINRGICDVNQARNFLNHSLDRLFDPFCIKDMDKAVKRIEKAVKEKQHITIYGDYDVDGMTAASVLYIFLKKNGCSVDVYLPDRHREGYGINKTALESISRGGTDLLISVDCGITALEEAAYAKELGMDLIITDHHQCGSILPDAVAVVNPRRNPDIYNEYQLAGVGVAGKLIHALGGVKTLEEYLDLISLGTIADIVPLVGENRILTAKGLEKINTSPRPGIEALIDVSRLGKGNIDAGRVAFGLAPRLNAAGRIAHPKEGFSLLTAGTMEEAIPLARNLEEYNRRRQEMEAEVIKKAEEMIECSVDLSRENIIVLGHDNWDSGVIGIAASKLTDKYNRPCILISISEQEGIGSARSIEGFNLYEALYSCRELFLRFGGHQQAAGFSILVDNIEKLKDRLSDYASRHITEDMLIPKLYYDVELKPSDINYDLIKELKQLEPCGTANPSPCFLLNNATVEDSRKVGKEGKHLKMSIGLEHRLWDAIAFNTGSQSDLLGPNQRISILTGLDRNEWNGISKIQFMVRHMEMHIDSPRDCANFLKPYYFKFFDAFFQYFMYNKKWEKNKDQYTKNKTSNLDEVILKFKNSRLGYLLIINTLDRAKEFLDKFTETRILSEVAVSYSNVNVNKGVGLNSCILAPSFHLIPYNNYKKIYVIDEERSFWNFQELQDWCGHKIYRIVDDSKKYNPEDNLIPYKVTRDDFVNVYRWIQSLLPGRALWQNWEELLYNYNKMEGSHEFNGFQMRLILAVFEELEFIKISSGYRFVKVECIKNPIRRNLDDSKLYCYYKTWLGLR